MHSPIFQALAREMALADRTICTGLTSIREADLSKNGTYSEAFFNLSIGLERIGKLIFILDHCYSNNGALPTDKDLRNFGHRLGDIIAHAKAVRAKYPIKDELGTWIENDIQNAIISCLSEFADGTRYYNLDYITGGKTKQATDPVKLWYESVIEPALLKHYSQRARDKDEAKVKELRNFGWDSVVMVRFTAEDGRPIDKFDDLTLHAHTAKIGNKWAQLYVLRIVRFLAILLMDLGWKAYELQYDFIPDTGDFFGKFRNEDKYFKTRKTWKAS